MKHKARKRFGQNFLTNQLIISRIIQSIGLSKTDYVIEIGPGKAALTVQLIKYCEQLTLIELDRDLIPLLKIELATKLDKIEIINQDALTVDFSALALNKANKFRLVGNLPYNISTPILFYLLKFRECIIDMHFMLQNEVVDRLSAVPGNKHYGRLSIMMQYYFNIEKKFLVPPEAFDPRPKVDSAIVCLSPYKSLIEAHKIKCLDENDLSLISKLSFQQRRKTIYNNLKEVIPAEAYKLLDIDRGCRAETLTINEFIKIANYYTENK